MTHKSNVKIFTFPGMKQHKLTSMYFVYVIDSIEMRVSMHVKTSECLANGWFLCTIFFKKEIR